MDKVVRRRLTRDAMRRAKSVRPARPILASCDVERLRLPEPCTQCLPSRPPDYLLIAPRIADDLPQRR
jgi:hypothetical protein